VITSSSLDEGDVVRVLRRTVDLLSQVPYCELVSEQLRRNARLALKAINRFPVCEVEDLVVAAATQPPATERPIAPLAEVGTSAAADAATATSAGPGASAGASSTASASTADSAAASASSGAAAASTSSRVNADVKHNSPDSSGQNSPATETSLP
jgi:hypothetical protein